MNIEPQTWKKKSTNKNLHVQISYNVKFIKAYKHILAKIIKDLKMDIISFFNYLNLPSFDNN